MSTIPITTIVQWCRMSTTTARNRTIADMMSPLEGLKHLNGGTSEEMVGTFRTMLVGTKKMERLYSPQSNKGDWYPSWIGWRIRLALKKKHNFQMERQGRNLYMNLKNPQLGRSTEKNKRKLGDILSRLAFKYSSKLPVNGIVGWWSLIST